MPLFVQLFLFLSDYQVIILLIFSFQFNSIVCSCKLYKWMNWRTSRFLLRRRLQITINHLLKERKKKILKLLSSEVGDVRVHAFINCILCLWEIWRRFFFSSNFHLMSWKILQTCWNYYYSIQLKCKRRASLSFILNNMCVF